MILIVGFSRLGIVIGGSVQWGSSLMVRGSRTSLLKARLGYLERARRRVGAVWTRSGVRDIGTVDRVGAWIVGIR